MVGGGSEDREGADVTGRRAAYLCSKEFSGINSRFVFVQGGLVGLFDPITVGQSLTKDGRWTLDELAAAIPTLRLPPLEGIY